MKLMLLIALYVTGLAGGWVLGVSQIYATQECIHWDR